MSCKFIGKGNLGNLPVLKRPVVDGESCTMVEMYVYFDRPVPVGDSDFEDRGGFWLNVEYWNEDQAERVATLLNRGCRVRIEGTLALNTWEGEEGEESKIILKAKDITLDLARVESVTFIAKAQDTETLAMPQAQVATSNEDSNSVE